MPYDEVIANRIRELLASTSDVAERRMFGGLAFLLAGNMAIAARSDGGAMVRIHPEKLDHLVHTTTAEPMVMKGRPMAGWVRVPSAALSNQRDVARWVKIAIDFTRTLPPKP